MSVDEAQSRKAESDEQIFSLKELVCLHRLSLSCEIGGIAWMSKRALLEDFL